MGKHMTSARASVLIFAAFYFDTVLDDEIKNAEANDNAQRVIELKQRKDDLLVAIEIVRDRYIKEK